MIVHRIAAFSTAGSGGNPAGVAVLDGPAAVEAMQRIAAEVGYSETAFLHPEGDAWRIRYFAPEAEVPFCGHATIATGALLGEMHGAGQYRLILSSGDEVVVTASLADGSWSAAFRSPPVWSKPMPPELLTELMELFGLTPDDLDPRLPPALIHGGATHPLIALADRRRLSQLGYAFEDGRRIQQREGFATIHVVHAESETLFHARGPFAVGGIYEDPATGAAAAALGGYLRDIGWPCSGSFLTKQGADFGRPSRICAEFDATPGGAVVISGETARIAEPLSFGASEAWKPVFFYGLHMDTDALAARGFQVVGAGIASLDGHEVRVHDKADLVPADGEKADGVLAFMPEPEFRRLYDGLTDYAQTKVALTRPGNPVKLTATTMVRRPGTPRGPADVGYAARFTELTLRLGISR